MVIATLSLPPVSMVSFVTVEAVNIAISIKKKMASYFRDCQPLAVRSSYKAEISSAQEPPHYRDAIDEAPPHCRVATCEAPPHCRVAIGEVFALRHVATGGYPSHSPTAIARNE